MFIGRTDAKAETPVPWPPHVKSWLIGKDPDAGRDWGQEEKGMTEDEMAGWHHWLDGRESEWTPGVGDGQGSLACCDSWGGKELDTTEWLNWTELNWSIYVRCSLNDASQYNHGFLSLFIILIICFFLRHTFSIKGNLDKICINCSYILLLMYSLSSSLFSEFTNAMQN